MNRRQLLKLSALALPATLAGFESQPANSLPYFTDIAQKAGLTAPCVYGGINHKEFILETNGCGVAFYDYDHDGWMDLLIPSGSRLTGAPPSTSIRLYKNNRDGTFTEVTKQAGLERVAWVSGVCIGDYNNDGFDDLFLSCWGQNLLFRNNGNGTFTDVTRQAGLLHPTPLWCAGCTFIDYNRDGHLDLFVSTYLDFNPETTPHPGATENCMWKGIAVNCGPKGLPTSRHLLYRNNGDGTFTDVSVASGIAKADKRYAMTAVSADFDNDGWPDIFVACDSTPSILYRNKHDGTFEDVGLEAGIALNEDGREQAGMGVGIGDAFGSGNLDIFKTHFADDSPVLYRAKGGGFYDDVTAKSGLGSFVRYVGWGAGIVDLDNDGLPEIFFVNGNVYPELEQHFAEFKYRNPRVLLQNKGAGIFNDISTQSGPGVSTPHSSRGCAFGDFDNDGDLDILVWNMNEPPSLLRNDLKSNNHWLKLKLVGTKSNRTALGATVIVTANGHKQRQDVLGQSSFYSQNDLRLHFGLGPAAKADSIEIRWPLGLRETYRNIPANQILTFKEGAASV